MDLSFSLEILMVPSLKNFFIALDILSPANLPTRSSTSALVILYGGCLKRVIPDIFFAGPLDDSVSNRNLYAKGKGGGIIGKSWKMG
jgi:hypothetical protein